MKSHHHLIWSVKKSEKQNTNRLNIFMGENITVDISCQETESSSLYNRACGSRALFSDVGMTLTLSLNTVQPKAWQVHFPICPYLYCLSPITFKKFLIFLTKTLIQGTRLQLSSNSMSGQTDFKCQNFKKITLINPAGNECPVQQRWNGRHCCRCYLKR